MPFVHVYACSEEGCACILPLSERPSDRLGDRPGERDRAGETAPVVRKAALLLFPSSWADLCSPAFAPPRLCVQHLRCSSGSSRSSSGRDSGSSTPFCGTHAAYAQGEFVAIFLEGRHFMVLLWPVFAKLFAIFLERFFFFAKLYGTFLFSPPSTLCVHFCRSFVSV